MTGMQRLAAAINGTESDRIPVFCNLLDQGAGALGMPLEEYYSRGECVAEAQLRMRDKYGHDNVWSLFYVGKEAELLGCRKILFASDGPPNVEEWVIKSLDDVQRLQVPSDVSSHPAFEEGLKCLRLLRQEVGGKYPICAYLTASMALPALLMGMEKWMELLFLGPAGVRDELLARCHEFFVKELLAYRNAGADVLVYSNPFGSTDIVPRKFFLEHSLPWIEKDVRAVGTPGLVYYCGMSRMNPVLATVLERTGIGVYYLGPFDDVREGKEILAGRALTCGVINDIRLIDWSREEIRREVKRIIEAGRPGGRFLFGTGVMPCGIPEANIRTMLEAAYEFGSDENGRIR
ncbi:MAG: uroporphyrinogen decarboxylase family protein [Verrucomicrobia bacterium]|nr:uroporphyrinogen decarboxylase family protein [Verrucomicrobiota bacterium]